MTNKKNLLLFRGAAIILTSICFCVRVEAEESNVNSGNSTETYSLMGPPGGVTLQPDGRIVIANCSHIYWRNADAGTFGMVSSGAFRFNQDGTLDRSFHCTIDTMDFSAPHITRLISDKDGRLLMTGPFNSVDGKPRPRFAMLLPNGRLDESFEPWRDFTNPPGISFPWSSEGGVYPVALLTNDCVAIPNSKLDSSGRFIPPQQPSALRRKFPNWLMNNLTPTGLGIQREVDWTKNTRTEWHDWPMQHPPPSLPFPQWGEKPSSLDMSEALQAIFEEVPLELCRYAVHLPDGGYILAVQENGGSRFMRFNKNWLPDMSYTNHFVTSVNSCISLALQPDGKLIVAGKISEFNGEPFPGLVRLNQTGAIDKTFNCHVVGGLDAPVMGVALQNDGRILIVGLFSQVNGINCPHFARLNSDGSLDQPFDSHFTSSDSLTASRRVKVHHLAVSPVQNNVTAATNTAAVVAVESPEQTVLITALNVANGVAVLQFQGNANSSYILQAATDLSQPNWMNVSTTQTDLAGKGTFRDEDAKNHSLRFYRVAIP